MDQVGNINREVGDRKGLAPDLRKAHRKERRFQLDGHGTER